MKELWIAAREECIMFYIDKFEAEGMEPDEAEMKAELFVDQSPEIIDEAYADMISRAIDYVKDTVKYENQ